MKLQVIGQMIAFTERETLVSGTVNKYRAEFVFDDSWDGYTKTAVFRADSFGHITSREVLLAGDACPVPHECLIAGALLRVGVYGISGDITTPTIYTQEPIGIARGAEPAESTQDPTPGVYQQIINIIEAGAITGPACVGVPSGGTAGQVLSKTEDGAAWTDPPSGGVQPDWSQNDPTAADYVKNRTHWTETQSFTLLDSLAITCAENSGMFAALGDFPAPLPLTEYPAGKTFFVTVDSVDYELTCSDLIDGYFWLGNMSFNGSHEDTGESFLFGFEEYSYAFVSRSGTQHTISVGGTQEVVTMLPPKYRKGLRVSPIPVDGVQTLTESEISEIKEAWANSIAISINVVSNNLYYRLSVCDITGDSIKLSGIYEHRGMSQCIVAIASLSTGVISVLSESYLGNIVENGNYYPVLNIANRKYKITVDNTGALKATELTT